MAEEGREGGREEGREGEGESDEGEAESLLSGKRDALEGGGVGPLVEAKLLEVLNLLA